MAQLHAANLEFYRLRGYSSLLTRCIKNEVLLDQFKLDFDVSYVTNSFLDDIGTFPVSHGKAMDASHAMKSNEALSKMAEEKKKYISSIGLQAKKIFDLKNLLKSSCNENTFKNASFFLSGLYGLFASMVDKEMDRIYDSAMSLKNMNKSVNSCWKDHLNTMLSTGTFDIIGKDFDAFLDEFPMNDSLFLPSEDENIMLHDENQLRHTTNEKSPETSDLNLDTSLPARNPLMNISNLEKTVMLRNGYVKKDGIVYNTGSSSTIEEKENVPVLKRKHEE